MENYLRIKKTYFNIIAIITTYIPIIRTKGIKSYIVSLIIVTGLAQLQ